MTAGSASATLQQLRQLLGEYRKQDALAADFGVDKSTVSRWLSGSIRTMRKRHRERLAVLCAPFEQQPREVRAEIDCTLAELGGGDDCNDDT